MKSAIPFAFVAQQGARSARRDAVPEPAAAPSRGPRLLRALVVVRP